MDSVDFGKVFGDLKNQIENVRNVCILAHVDHGKTTLADLLVTCNGIISKRMAGQLRYMDYRSDEQERGITMKSSGIALYYKRTEHAEIQGRKEYLINLIDSPGHVDFSSEVSSAVRLCDGALLVVDVVEGVCPQTRACLQQIYEEHLKPVLVFNKIDRLILEKQLTPLDAYYHLLHLLEKVNATLGSIFATDVMAKEDLNHSDNYVSPLEYHDDSSLYFNPSVGNVIFCSAYDGWGFTLQDFVKAYSKILDISSEDLNNYLWGDFYYSSKKIALSGAQSKAKKPMFVQFVLENIWSLYDTIVIKKDKEKIPLIAEKLNITVRNRDIRSNDIKLQIKMILGQWLPIERATLEMVIKHIPPPLYMTTERAQNLLFNRNANLKSYPEESLKLIDDFKKCDSESDKIIIFVSKMFAIPTKQLNNFRKKCLTQEELQRKRSEVVKRLKEKKECGEQISQDFEKLVVDVAELTIKESNEQQHICLKINSNETVTKSREYEREITSNGEESDFVFLAFARIFSGTVRKGQKLYSLAPKYDPRKQNSPENLESPYISEVIIGDLYLFMGADLLEIDEVPAGNIVGISGLDNHIIKTGTLSNSPYCSAFSEYNYKAQPLIKIAIEPENPSQMPQLIKGLKMLNQADACVQVSIETNGEHVITTLGEMHTEKCIRDLEENYAKCKITVSEPIVSFRETIVPEPQIEITSESSTEKLSEMKSIEKKIVSIQTMDKMCTIKVVALPLRQKIVGILEKYQNFFSELSAMFPTVGTNSIMKSVSNKSEKIILQIRRELKHAFETDFDNQGIVQLSGEKLLDCIWSFGPKYCGSNILLNLTDYKHPEFLYNQLNQGSSSTSKLFYTDKRHHYNNAFLNGFQISTISGPLCEEPMQGVCFAVLDWSMVSEFDDNLSQKNFGPFSGQLLNAVKDACRQAFQNQPQRLVTPMYSCTIVVNSDVLGKMYAVLSKRHGKIISADLLQGSENFFVTATLPVIESFNFTQEIRKQTSGLAYPHLMFSHWEVVDMDPFWVPNTEEESTFINEKAHSINRAKLYMNRIRRRKGLLVDDKIVQHAEKQRTLSKKK